MNDSIAEGFKELREAITEMSNAVATLTERIENMRSDQKEIKAAMKEIEETKRAVDKNTAFRKTAVKVVWIIATVVLIALTTAALFGFGSYLVK